MYIPYERGQKFQIPKYSASECILRVFPCQGGLTQHLWVRPLCFSALHFRVESFRLSGLSYKIGITMATFEVRSHAPWIIEALWPGSEEWFMWPYYCSKSLCMACMCVRKTLFCKVKVAHLSDNFMAHQHKIGQQYQEEKTLQERRKREEELASFPGLPHFLFFGLCSVSASL